VPKGRLQRRKSARKRQFRCGIGGVFAGPIAITICAIAPNSPPWALGRGKNRRFLKDFNSLPDQGLTVVGSPVVGDPPPPLIAGVRHTVNRENEWGLGEVAAGDTRPHPFFCDHARVGSHGPRPGSSARLRPAAAGYGLADGIRDQGRRRQPAVSGQTITTERCFWSGCYRNPPSGFRLS
jgi:hypothetical protein